MNLKALLPMVGLLSSGVGAATLSSDYVLTIGHEDVVDVRPASDVSQDAFFRDWGQFELRIPKERFPIRAPHCRKSIILRVPGVAPRAGDRARKLEQRWNLFEAILALKKNQESTVKVPLGRGPYIENGVGGGPQLQYCNAYVDAKALDAKQGR